MSVPSVRTAASRIADEGTWSVPGPIRLAMAVSVIVAAVAVLLGLGTAAHASEPSVGTVPQATDTRGSDGFVVFRHCLDADCGPEANETSLRIKSLRISGFTWPKLKLASAGTMRFAGDPSIGRSSSKVAVGVTFTLDFSRGGSIQMAAGLGETWENALGIPSLALTHFAFVGDLRYGQMTLDTSAAVEFGGVVSADVAGQLVLKPNLPLEYHLEGTQSFQLFGFTLQSAHFVVDDTDGVFVEGTLDLGVAQVSLHGSFWRDAGGVDRFDLGGSQNITLSGFTVQSTSWRVSNDPNPAVNGITMSGSLNIYVAQVSVSGHFWQSNGLRYHLTGSQSIGLGGFTLQSASIVVDNATGVTAAGSVSIPLIGTASMSGSLNASGGTLQYNLTGQTAASFVGFSTTAYLTLSNAGMRMTTTLNNGSWINQTFTGYVASNGAFDISTNGTLNLTNRITGQTGLATTFRLRSTGSSITLSSSTTVAVLGFNLTFAGNISASGFSFSVRAPTTGTQQACLELLVVRGCVNYYYDFTLSSAAGLDIETHATATAEVWVVFCLCWVGGEVGGIGYEYSFGPGGVMHLTIRVSVLGSPDLPIAIF